MWRLVGNSRLHFVLVVYCIWSCAIGVELISLKLVEVVGGESMVKGQTYTVSLLFVFLFILFISCMLYYYDVACVGGVMEQWDGYLGLVELLRLRYTALHCYIRYTCCDHDLSL